MDWSSRLVTGGSGCRAVSASELHWRVHWSHRPKLLILDEATSALNPRDEDAVANNLKNLLPEMTLIIVAHKLGSLGLGRAVLSA
jgi:ABC-type transport system involved in cytochrome bd biosynthesis fused ATPase/permease subunit